MKIFSVLMSLFLASCISKADQIKIGGLKSALSKLKDGQTEYNFIGITSNGIDCIYFVYENGEFNLEFEAMSEEQLPFIKKLEKFAKFNKLKISVTTYNNTPSYKSDKPAPVLRMETKSTLDNASVWGEKIEAEVFKNDKATIYDVVP